MIKKKYILLILILILYLIGECIYLPLKNKEFTDIRNMVLNTRIENISKKEEQIKSEYNFNDYLDYNIEYSKILFRNIYDFKDEITIYKGNDYNIKKDYLVVNKDGLVGIVNEVRGKTSSVQLLNNKNTSLSVKINNYYGILKCINDILIIEGIDNKSLINIGDKIVTSDISLYPENILIGYVESINYDKYEIEQIITVKPVVDFNYISYVGIIKNLRGIE